MSAGPYRYPRTIRGVEHWHCGCAAHVGERWLPRAEFYERTCGLPTWECRACMRARQRAYAAAHRDREAHRAYMRQWRRDQRALRWGLPVDPEPVERAS